LLKLSDGFSFVKKVDCSRNSTAKNPKNEASMNPMLDRIGSVSIAVDAEMMDINNISGNADPL
jgi:hypothetical protein